MYRYLGKLKEKWSHSDNKILWECYVRSINPKNTYDLWIQGEMRETLSQRIKSWTKQNHSTVFAWARTSNWSSSWSQQKKRENIVVNNNPIKTGIEKYYF